MLKHFTKNQEHRIREYFLVSVIIKGVISFAETVAGIAAFFIPVATVSDAILRYANGELVENSHDFIATQLTHLAHDFAFASSTFIGLYLLSRGFVKLLLIIGLLKNQLWAYPSSLAVIGLFVLYQIYQIITGFSGLLVALTIFDLFVMWSIWEEYKVVRSHKKKTV